MLLGKSKGQLLIDLVRMKWLDQTGNDAQLQMCLVVKEQCCKEQYCIGTWNVGSMSQGKQDMVKQEMARLNMDILRSEQKWTGREEFNSDDYYVHYSGQESLSKNWSSLHSQPKNQNAVTGCNLTCGGFILIFGKTNTIM